LQETRDLIDSLQIVFFILENLTGIPGTFPAGRRNRVEEFEKTFPGKYFIDQFNPAVNLKCFIASRLQKAL
jgi:hypothetical protein